MSGKVRVYEVARDLGMENKTLVALFQSVGISEVRNHMSAVAPEQVERVKRHLDKQSAQKVVEERIRPTVVKRRTVKPKKKAPPPAEAKPAPARPPQPAAPPPSAAAAPPPPPAPAPSAPAAAPPPAEPVKPAPAAEAKPAPAPEPPKPEPAPSPPSAKPEPAAAAPVAEKPAEEKPSGASRPSQAPRTGVEVWEGRPGVSMAGHHSRAPTPRRVQYDAKAGGAQPGPRHGRGPMMGRYGRGLRSRGIGSMAPRKGGQPVTQERSERKKKVKIEGSVTLQVLAGKMGIKATELLMKLMGLGMTGVNINSTLDADTAKIVANEFGWDVEDVAVSEDEQLEAAQGGGTKAEEEEGREPRPPVVTVMGHVDHGKTSLLDKIRKANVVEGEAGGITQHIGAYRVDTSKGPVCFLDTPGHEAFTAMRARGAQATDLVILVVAADDGVMPQTKEAVNHAKAAKVPIVVAVNKIDKPDAQPEKVRRELSELELVPEEWGGDTLFTEVSAITGQGIEELLEQTVLQSEVLELKANPNKPANGIVVEAKLDRGKGPVATILVTDGTLNRGEVILAGSAHGKVRAMLDDHGRNTTKAGPSTPVEIIGLNDVPSAGDPVHVIKDAKKAQEIAQSRKTKERSLMPGGGGLKPKSLEEIAEAMKEADKLELRTVVKADVQGSVEALSEALTKLSAEKVKVTVVHSAVGAITETDVNLATASGAIIIGFNVRPAGKATGLAQKEGVQIRQYDVIYNVVDDVKAAMEGLLAPTLVEKELGKAEIRKVFRIAKVGNVAGCMVTSGLIKRSGSVRLVRDGTVTWKGKLSSLKRFKDDAREVKDGFECGLSFEGFNDVKEGDIVECYEVEEVKQTL